MGRIVFAVMTGLLALWLLGALAQGLLFQLSLVGHKVWLFNVWFQKFGLGLLVGLVLGFLACLAVVRRRRAA
jgi:hypothetical protein